MRAPRRGGTWLDEEKFGGSDTDGVILVPTFSSNPTFYKPNFRLTTAMTTQEEEKVRIADWSFYVDGKGKI